jgi:hypothetical protein
LESPEQAAARLGSPVLTPSERALVWDRIQSTHEGSRPRSTRALVWAVGAVALSAAALVFGLTLGRDPAEGAAAGPPACRLDSSAPTLELPASCEARPVRVGDDEWVLMPGAKVSRIEEGARVESGKVEFRVRKRPRADFRVHVGGGHQVRVIGTVFKIEQEGASGSVSVTEGVIEFTWNDGTRERVAAGQTLFWPRRVAARASAEAGGVAPPAPLAPSKSGSSAPAPSAPSSTGTAPKSSASPHLESVMDRVLLLKSQRRYGELTALLQKTLNSPDVGSVQRQRLSYELGLALEGAGKNACDHWKRHARVYGAGAQGGALASKLERCKP